MSSHLIHLKHLFIKLQILARCFKIKMLLFYLKQHYIFSLCPALGREKCSRICFIVPPPPPPTPGGGSRAQSAPQYGPHECRRPASDPTLIDALLLRASRKLRKCLLYCVFNILFFSYNRLYLLSVCFGIIYQ